MNAKSKKILKVAAAAAGLSAVLLPTGCSLGTPADGQGAMPAPGSPAAVVAPPTVD